MTHSKEKKKKFRFMLKTVAIIIVGTVIAIFIILDKRNIEKRQKEELQFISDITGIKPENILISHSNSINITIDTNWIVYEFNSKPDSSKTLVVPKGKQLMLVFELNYCHTFWDDKPSISIYPSASDISISETSNYRLPNTFNKLDFKSLKRKAYISFYLNNIQHSNVPYFCNISFNDFSLVYATNEAYRNKIKDRNQFDYVYEKWGSVLIKTVFY